MGLFYKDFKNNVIITWDTLLKDINNTTIYNPYCKSDNYYDVFKQVIISMIIGKEVILLDSDFSDNELINLTGYSRYDRFNQLILKRIKLKSKKELIKRLRETNNNWEITLFTSGTTGIPKKATHNFNSITRYVKYSEENTKSIWGFAFNPTHMAGIQVFLQAILNGSTIIRLFGLSPDDIKKEIEDNKITHISATPTFYKLLLPFEAKHKTVKRITLGGEKLNKKTILQLKRMFPKAKINNVYASTEFGTLFASDDETFTVRPQFIRLIKIEDNELLIHKTLMGRVDINIQEWYHTGDLVNLISTNPLRFQFLTRKSDLINVGGYKVNPTEVEDAILTLSGIKDVRVYAKSNSLLGNIICCDVVCNDNQVNESIIRTYLQSKIQEFKIPRIIRFVNELSTTRTGKIKRK